MFYYECIYQAVKSIYEVTNMFHVLIVHTQGDKLSQIEIHMQHTFIFGHTIIFHILIKPNKVCLL